MLPHTLITASAGSGKTWRLTVRYLRLLMLGAEPESIVALTFSRKAAGEFFNAILHRLAEAAAGTDAAARLAEDIGRPGTTPEEFCQALAGLTARLPRLMLGTLDSFFIRMARSFPFELGLGGDFTLLDEHSQSVEQLRVYERVFAPDSGAEGARREFMQAFSEATHGREEVGVRRALDGFVRQWHALFLTALRAEQWGEPAVIWPRNAPVPGPGKDRAATVERIRTAMERADLTDKQRDRWTAFLDDALAHRPGGTFTRPFGYLFTKLLETRQELRQGHATLTVERKKQTVDGPAAEALTDLCDDLLAGEIMTALRQTKGIHEVIRRYDAAYHELVRRRGRLTFSDVQMVLSGGMSPEASGEAARGARALTHEENRQLMDYRMDARYHHWLLDEFQDTSRVQWRVLANLIDEAVQDSEGRKSFFAVGDQKQSIYEWRGGTPALFDEIERQYNSGAADPANRPILIEPLSLSQRSGPAVIGLVNELMGNKEALAEVLPPAAVEDWPWQHHESRNVHYGGEAAVIEVPDEEDGEAPGEPAAEDSSDGETDEAAPVNARWRRAADWLVEFRPLKRGLTCAVLCHRNRSSLDLADFLRSATGMEVVCESDLPIARDNPATSVLLALIQAAAHPADRFAWRQVMMSPLAGAITKEFPTDESRSARRADSLLGPVQRKVLGQISEGGFHGMLLWWTAALRREVREAGSFTLGRLDELCACARKFDAGGSRDADEFLTFADSWRVRGAGHAGAIQVMTVHRSKGLTFDVVLIPDLDSKSFRPGQPLGIKTGEGGEVEWLMKLPVQAIARTDSVLAEAMQRAEASQWRERMAGLYVMVTRARYAMYLFLKPAPKKPGPSPSLAKTVRHLLAREGAGEYKLSGKSYPLLARFGDPDWIRAHPLKPASRPATPPLPGKGATQTDLFAPPPPEPTPARRVIPLRARRPSGDGTEETGGLFHQSAREAAKEAGTAVHAAFRLIGWRQDAEAALASSGLDPEAVAEVRACLAEPALREFFDQPAESAEVWRERAFDIVLDGVPHSGVFDRAVIRRGADGRPAGAVIVDFKTGPVVPSEAAAAARHRRQMSLYRTSLSRLLGLPEENIRAVVLFTATRRAVDL